MQGGLFWYTKLLFRFFFLWLLLSFQGSFVLVALADTIGLGEETLAFIGPYLEWFSSLPMLPLLLLISVGAIVLTWEYPDNTFSRMYRFWDWSRGIRIGFGISLALCILIIIFELFVI